MKISLILATYGRTEQIGRLLDSLAMQTLKAHELIVVDQNPDDRVTPLVAYAEELGLKTQHVRLSRPNLSAARNAGLAKATGDVVGFPDDDCWYEPTTLASVSAGLMSNPEWQGLVAEWEEQAAGMSTTGSRGELDLGLWRRFRGGEASSISLFLQRGALLGARGFDERIGVGQWFGAGEETDLVLTLLGRGAVIGRWPEARVHHVFGPGRLGKGQEGLRAMRARARGTGALYAKHALPLHVVLRGIAAPAAKALIGWRGLYELRAALALSVGRLQGMIMWHFRSKA